MNAKQAMRAKQRNELIKEIADLTFVNSMNAADIVSYNQCIDSMIAGGSPCPFCHDFADDCDHPECREAGKGCESWMLRMKTPEEVLGTEKKNSQEEADGNVL